MRRYKISFKKSAAKELESIPNPALQRIIKKIGNLANDPCPKDSRKLTNYDLFRIRQGDYRIIYVIDNKRFEIEIYKIGHRKDIYKF